MDLRSEGYGAIEDMRLGVDYKTRIQLRSFSITVRPLSMLETLQVEGNCQMEFSRVPEPAKTQLRWNHIFAKETLKLATTSDIGATDSSMTDAVMEKMTPEELQALMKQYVAAVDRVNPILETVNNKEDLGALVEQVKKNPSQLTELSLSQLMGLCRHLIFGD